MLLVPIIRISVKHIRKERPHESSRRKSIESVRNAGRRIKEDRKIVEDAMEELSNREE